MTLGHEPLEISLLLLTYCVHAAIQIALQYRLLWYSHFNFYVFFGYM